MEAMLFLTMLWCLLEMDFLFSTELVLDSMTTVSYNSESLFLLNWIAKNFNTMELCAVVVFKTSINFRVSFPKMSNQL